MLSESRARKSVAIGSKFPFLKIVKSTTTTTADEKSLKTQMPYSKQLLHGIFVRWHLASVILNISDTFDTFIGIICLGCAQDVRCTDFQFVISHIYCLYFKTSFFC